MGMADTRTHEFSEMMTRFGTAIDAEDYKVAQEAYTELDASLHPASHIRKLLRLQLASIAGTDDDQA